MNSNTLDDVIQTNNTVYNMSKAIVKLSGECFILEGLSLS